MVHVLEYQEGSRASFGLAGPLGTRHRGKRRRGILQA
jgi:hypothetical protein